MKKILSAVSAIFLACVLTITMAIPGFAAQTYAMKTLKVNDPIDGNWINLQYQYNKNQKTLTIHNAEKKKDNGEYNGQVAHEDWTSKLYIPDNNINFQNIKLYLRKLQVQIEHGYVHIMV